jgi:hypothetical protein
MRGKAICWQKQKNIIFFLFLLGSVMLGGQNLKIGQSYSTPQGRRLALTPAFLLISTHSKRYHV